MQYCREKRYAEKRAPHVVLGYKDAAELAAQLGIKSELVHVDVDRRDYWDLENNAPSNERRPMVVSVMGHVDHGKTVRTSTPSYRSLLHYKIINGLFMISRRSWMRCVGRMWLLVSQEALRSPSRPFVVRHEPLSNSFKPYVPFILDSVFFRDDKDVDETTGKGNGTTESGERWRSSMTLLCAVFSHI